MTVLLVVAVVASLVQGLSWALHSSRAAATAATGTGGEFVALQGRILDTRNGTGGYSTPMPAGTWRPVDVDGQVGIPASGVSAVAVSFTVIAPSVSGVINADKGGVGSPSSTVSYLNYEGYGATQSNTAVMAVGTNGGIQVKATTSTDLVIDVEGYYTSGDTAAGGYVPITPTRIVDTRSGLGAPMATIVSGGSITVQATGVAGIPAGASGVMVNLTVLDTTTTAGYLTPYQADVARPATSLNFPGTTAPTSLGAQVGLSSTGTPMGAFKVYQHGTTINLLVDVVGYFTAATTSGAFTPASTRVYDSRVSPHTALAANATLTLPVAGVAGVPVAGDGISAITANLAVIDSGSSSGYVRVWADGTSEPATSNINFTHGLSATANMVTTAIGTDGEVKIHNVSSDSINIVLDTEGWYTTVGAAVPSGQDSTQRYVTLQGTEASGGTWVTYEYRNGPSGTFANVPNTAVSPAPSGSGSNWPEHATSTSPITFTAHTWDLQATLGSTDALVQVEACFGQSATDPNPVCSMPSNITYSPSTFGDNNATTDVGPGSLSLLTGDYQVSATDADAASSLGSLSIGRSLTTLAPAAANSGPGGVFGPGWTADLAGSDAGDGDLTVTDDSSAGYLVFTDPDGGTSTYQAIATLSGCAGTSYGGVGDAAGDGEVVCKASSTSITMTDPDGTVTTWTSSAGIWSVQSIVQTGAAGTAANTTTSYSYNGSGLVTRILAPAPTGITCTSAPDTTPGCRSLVLTYETISVAGVNVTRLQTVSVSLPQTSGTSNIVAVADYDYYPSGAGAGYLQDAYDPRITPHLTTTYTYDSNGRLSTLTPPGEAAWTFAYTSGGQLSTVSRPDPSGPTATDTIVYNVPTSGTGLPDVSATTAATWGETGDLPLTGTAVFTADHVPAGTTVATVASSDWPYATVHYLDVNGREVNTADYGAGAWLIDTAQYDANGNDVWDLSAGNRAQALTPTGSTDSYVAGLSTSAARAALLASSTVYNPLIPSQVTDTYGPTHPVELESGTVIHAQTHVATTYDQGAPNSDVNPTTGAAYGLPTTVVSDPYNVVTAADTGYPDTQTTTTGYAAVGSMSTDGWTLGQATSSTVQMGSTPNSSVDLTTTTVYNATGQAIATWLPGDSTGTTPRTTDTTYYTPTGSGSCVSAVWAGLVCSTAPGAQPSTGNPLAVTSYTYDQYGNVLTKTETYGTTSPTVRTTTDTYDPAERELTSGIVVTPTAAGGTALPTVTYGYDSGIGLPTTVQTGPGPTYTTLTTGYDDLGRVTSYTDANGTVSTTGYDLDGNVTSVNDGQGTTTYTIDSSTEHRGLVTGENIGVTGALSAFSATYDTAGNLATETYPNGLVATTSYDNAGNATDLIYQQGSSTWLHFTATNGDQDRTVAQTSATSTPQSSQAFSYDQDDRLTAVQDTSAGACATRTYAFDNHSNRTSLTAYPAGTGGVCSTSTSPTTTSYTVDQADRLTSDTAGSYTYDTLGRATTVPAGDALGNAGYATTTGNLTVGYDSNDMVATQAQGSTTLTFTLDPLQNRVNTQSDGTTTTTDHYNDATDSPAWTSTSPSVWTRDLSGPDGNLAATTDQTGTVTLQLTNLHGDTVATAADTTTATGVATYSETTEYGAPRVAASAPATYGWLGAKQRSSADLAGLTLMGVRLYDPGTGRFLSVDPVPGGNANTYNYPNDPIGGTDLTGMYGCGQSQACGAKQRQVRAYEGGGHNERVDVWELDFTACFYVCFTANFSHSRAGNYGGVGGGLGPPGASLSVTPLRLNTKGKPTKKELRAFQKGKSTSITGGYCYYACFGGEIEDGNGNHPGGHGRGPSFGVGVPGPGFSARVAYDW